jgi:uncharacterized membrane protein required for colicin V production
MIPDWLSLIDLTFLSVALLFAWGGYQKGFAGQVAHVATLLIFGGALFTAYPALFNALRDLFYNLNETYLMWLLMVGLAVLVLILFILISKLLSRLLKAQISERSDKVYGLLLGLVRGTLAALLGMIFLVILGPDNVDENFRDKSYTGRLVCQELVPRIQPHLTRDSIGDKVQTLREKLLEQEDAGVIE